MNVKVDNLNNSWYIYNSKIVRTSAEKSYNDTLLGSHIHEITMDLNISLKNLLYYTNKNWVEVRNSRLGILSQFSLDHLKIYQPAFVKFSTDKMIWILDRSDNHLYKLSENGVKISQSVNPFKVKNTFYFPNEFIQLRNYSIAFDKSYGVFILDDYGNLTQSIKMDSCHKIFKFKEMVYLSKGKKLIQFQTNIDQDINLNQTKSLELSYPIISLQKLYENALILLENRRLYIVKNFETLFK